MNTIVMTQTGGILGPFAYVLGIIMNYIYRFLEMFGISNVALTIILFTLIINVILIPLTIKQQRFQKMSSIMQPEMKKIQKKYEGKKDEVSMRLQQAETQALYDKYGSSPTAGCLPLLVQLPILFSLYRVIYNVPAYVEPVKEIYMKIAEPIMNSAGSGPVMEQLIQDMTLRVTEFDITNINKIIDTLYLVKSTAWDAVAQAFEAVPDAMAAVQQFSPDIIKINSFVGGLNIADAPVNWGGGFSGIFPGILIPILAGASQHLNIALTQSANSSDGNDAMSSSMKTMNYTMPLMSVVFCISLPTGLGIYWIASAVFRSVIFIIIDRFFSIKDVDKLVEQNKEKAAKKAEKRAEKEKNLEQYAQMRTSKKSISEIAGRKSEQPDRSSYSKNSGQTGEKSISGYAHMVKRKDDK